MPCAVALVAVPLPLVSVLFERGAFGTDDTAATALAVAIYGLGLPAFVLQKILQPLFFAREDTKSPFRYAVVAMVVNAAVAIGLALSDRLDRRRHRRHCRGLGDARTACARHAPAMARLPALTIAAATASGASLSPRR